ncbi:MAG: tRNA (adenosine(37)-N6)-threonylcarbamoyltransferase complex transferase subunit TsaD [Deltaproteobacteria bacterium]|nr:tRNA (adenosine(37)-N6)-threonylcarbamoyltransferase complex transferase subunit TsaD [Deltaproteobacteria bacterium]
MNILGIDTSCDDTSAGVVRDGRNVLSNIVQSQVMLHGPHGGVVPELASREHLKNIVPAVHEALAKAGIQMSDLDAVAVTVGPGLVGSLLVGLYYAKSLAYVNNIPLVAVNHLEGHIISIFLEEKIPEFPFVALTVSGGHTSLYHVKGYGRYFLLGQTLDDAAGEAFDKVAKILGLGYPGGALIERLSRSGDMEKIKFPRPYLSNDSLDFSFSGLKTSVSLYLKRLNENQAEISEKMKADIAASFQESVMDVLVNKLMRARENMGAESVVMAGGVACNKRLRDRLLQAASGHGVQMYYPRPEYCTDNGAMIAAAAYHRLLNGERSDFSIDVRSKFPVSELEEIV